MTDLETYARQSPYSDPRSFAHLFNDLPTDIRELTAVIRNLVVHYRADGLTFGGDRLAEIDARWVDRMLAADQSRHAAALAAPREKAERIVGCCRDFTLLTVSALRHRGVPARSRIGFANYFTPGWHHDHVVAEYWNGQRWVWVDAELDPAGDWPFDPADLPHLIDGGLDNNGARRSRPDPFASAAAVWTAFRAGETDAQTYGVDPNLPITGAWLVRNYVLLELAHRRREELLLWDGWGAMAGPDELGDDLDLIDEAASLLLAADAAEGTPGSAQAEAELARRYEQEDELHPGERVQCHSPRERIYWVDLRTREPVPVA